MLDLNKADIERIKCANHIVFFSGAGMSAESGITTFRGKDGIWNKFKPEELANFNAFMKNPSLVWEWYHYRRDIVKRALPNAGHLAIDRKSTRLNSSHLGISYAVFCLKKNKKE